MPRYMVVTFAQVDDLPTRPGPPRGPHEFISEILDALQETVPDVHVGADPSRTHPSVFFSIITIVAADGPSAKADAIDKFRDALEGVGMKNPTFDPRQRAIED
jgi:hypothetical protein